MRSKVYVAQQTARFDKDTSVWVPIHNLGPATKFGELVVCLPPQVSFWVMAPIEIAMAEKLALFDAEKDYLLDIGAPQAIRLAGEYVSRVAGGVYRSLVWDRQEGEYLVFENDRRKGFALMDSMRLNYERKKAHHGNS